MIFGATRVSSLAKSFRSDRPTDKGGTVDTFNTLFFLFSLSLGFLIRGFGSEGYVSDAFVEVGNLIDRDNDPDSPLVN